MANTEPIADSILIDATAEDVFAALVDTANLARLSQNTDDVRVLTDGPIGQGSLFRRNLWSHGIRNAQVVSVQVPDPGRSLVTRTKLVGFDVFYRYMLSTAPNGGTRLALVKEGRGGWGLLRPLLVHLLTRPEHDGDHLQRVRTLVESRSGHNG